MKINRNPSLNIFLLLWNSVQFAPDNHQKGSKTFSQSLLFRNSELPRLIEVGASCFFDSGYCHTANWQFSQNLRKRLRSARSRPTILLFFMLPVSAYLRFWYLLQRWYPGHEPHHSPGISIPVCGDPGLLDSGSHSNGKSGLTERTYLLWQAEI